MKKICPKCRTEFECKHSSNCWCIDVKITEELTNYLRKNYNDCLCRNCLNNYILTSMKDQIRFNE
jgi:hypothetical protein